MSPFAVLIVYLRSPEALSPSRLAVEAETQTWVAPVSTNICTGTPSTNTVAAY